MRFGKKMMLKCIAERPIPKKDTYLKFGFVITEHTHYHCPRCGWVLSAGPNYQPKYCDQCGQRVTFDGIEWEEEKELGFLPPGHREEDMNHPGTECRGADDEAPELAV